LFTYIIRDAIQFEESTSSNLQKVCDIYFLELPIFDFTRSIQAVVLILTIAITIVSHSQVKKSAKNTALLLSLKHGINPKFYMWFPIALQICYVPLLLHLFLFKIDFIFNITGSIWRSLHTAIPTVILIVYLKMRRAIKKEKRRLASIHSSKNYDGKSMRSSKFSSLASSIIDDSVSTLEQF